MSVGAHGAQADYSHFACEAPAKGSGRKLGNLEEKRKPDLGGNLQKLRSSAGLRIDWSVKERVGRAQRGQIGGSNWKAAATREANREAEVERRGEGGVRNQRR